MEEKRCQEKIVEFRVPKNQDRIYYDQGNTVPFVEEVRGEDRVDDLLKKYIEKVDRDQDALRNDIRESEKRIDNAIERSETRMDNHLKRIEEMINEQNKRFDEQNKKIDELKEKVSEKLEDDKKYRHTNNIAIVIGVVTTVLAMVGIYYATISSITNIIGVFSGLK